MPVLKTFAFSLLLFFSCSLKPTKEKFVQEVSAQDSRQSISIDSVQYNFFDRTECLKKIMQKKKNKEALIVHVFVPLCDNVNQGIVPVNASLGNGKSLRTNLYWGAGYGVKSYFKKLKDWKLISSSLRGNEVLERVVFKKTFPDKSEVYLVADAYSGDQMELCLKEYFASLTGDKDSTISINDSTSIKIYSSADLVIFNGHNGLMDVDLKVSKSIKPNKNEAIAIACYSHSYFRSHWFYANSYPILSTTHLLAPEAYTIEAVLNAWSKGKSGIEIRNAAAKAYSDKHSCSYKTGQKLFKTGW